MMAHHILRSEVILPRHHSSMKTRLMALTGSEWLISLKHIPFIGILSNFNFDLVLIPLRACRIKRKVVKTFVGLSKLQHFEFSDLGNEYICCWNNNNFCVTTLLKYRNPFIKCNNFESNGNVTTKILWTSVNNFRCNFIRMQIIQELYMRNCSHFAFVCCFDDAQPHFWYQINNGLYFTIAKYRTIVSSLRSKSILLVLYSTGH